MYLSQPKQTSKFSKSLNYSSFGKPLRSPRTVSSSLQSYSDTFEETSHNFPSYSETFTGDDRDPEVEEKAPNGGTTARTVTERLETQKTETIHTEIPETQRTETVYTEVPETQRSETIYTERPSSITERIETYITDHGVTEKLYTLTEHIESQLSDTEKLELSSHQYSYTDAFDSTEHRLEEDSITRSQYTDRSQESQLRSNYSENSDESLTRSQYSETHSPQYSDTETSATFEEETVYVSKSSQQEDFPTYSERDYSLDFEDATKSETYDYSYTFEPTETSITDDPEKLQREEELRKISQEAEENFISSMITHIRQKPIRDTDISILIDQELEGEQDEEELDPRCVKFLRRKLHLLKKKKKFGDPQPDEKEKNLWAKDRQNYIADYGVHPAILNKLKLKNFVQSMESAANFEIHDPKTCEDCRRHEEAIDSAAAERNFIRIKTRDTRQRVMEDQYHKHLVKMSSINLIAEIARSLPKHTDDPEDITDKLFRGLSLSKSVTDNRINGT